MRIVKKDIWDFIEKGKCIVIPTNGHVNSDGKAVMGRGIAYQASKLFKGLQIALGKLVNSHGNQLFYFPRQKLITFPTKNHWKDKSNLELIEESCKKLVNLMRQNPNMEVVMPKVGCGWGKLDWDRVAPIIQGYFNEFSDTRFMIVDNESGDCGTEWLGDNKFSQKVNNANKGTKPKIV